MSELLLTPDLREGEQIEFKSQWVDKALEDLCAFANTSGDNLFVGVNDDGSVAGLSGLDKEMQSIANKISESLGLSPRMAWLNTGGNKVLVVSVHRSDWLVALKGRHLVRVGSTNREMPKEDVARRILRQVGCAAERCGNQCNQSRCGKTLRPDGSRFEQGQATAPRCRAIG